MRTSALGGGAGGARTTCIAAPRLWGEAAWCACMRACVCACVCVCMCFGAAGGVCIACIASAVALLSYLVQDSSEGSACCDPTSTHTPHRCSQRWRPSFTCLIRAAWRPMWAPCSLNWRQPSSYAFKEQPHCSPLQVLAALTSLTYMPDQSSMAAYVVAMQPKLASATPLELN